MFWISRSPPALLANRIAQPGFACVKEMLLTSIRNRQEERQAGRHRSLSKVETQSWVLLFSVIRGDSLPYDRCQFTSREGGKRLFHTPDRTTFVTPDYGNDR